MVKVSGKKKEINDIFWSVMTSFGFSEVEESDSLYEELKTYSGKYCFLNKNEICAFTAGENNVLKKAELAALCAEAIIANGLDDFEISVGDKDVFKTLDLFGLEKIVKLESGREGFCAVSGDVVFAEGKFGENISECRFNIEKFCKALEAGGVDMTDEELSASLIYAEENAEGAAYDVAYNLRVNGCIVEYYCEGGNIDDAQEYAKNKGMSCILRAYADGKLDIKDFVKNEITETTVADFLGYYEADEDECDCGHEHHHGEDCGCGCH